MEFISAQKNKNLGEEKMQKVFTQISTFFAMKKKDQDKLILEHQENFKKQTEQYEQVWTSPLPLNASFNIV